VAAEISLPARPFAASQHGAKRLKDREVSLLRECIIISHARRTPYALRSNFAPRRRMIMKTILSALLALSVLAGIASSASAFDSDKFWKDHATSGER
jgi:hypothetical protein